MINSGGENVYPDEIEAALARCPAVADVVVVGLPDERWGQAVTAFVVPAAGVGPGEAVAASRRPAPAGVAARRCKRPKRVVAVDAVPALRRSARRCAACSSPATSTRSRTPPEPRDDLDARPRSRTPRWSAAPAGSSTTSTRCPARWWRRSCAARTRTPGIRGVDLARARAHPGVAAVIGPGRGRARRCARSRCPPSTPMPYLPERRRQGALRRRAGRGGRRGRPLRRRGRRRARRRRLRAARRRRRHPRGARARGAPLLHDRTRARNVATDRTFSFGDGRRRLRRAPTTSCTGEYTFPRYSSVPMECYARHRAVARGVRRAPPSRRGRTSTGRSRWCR